MPMQRHLTATCMSVLLSLAGASAAHAQSSMQQIVERMFTNAILKVTVSGKSAKFDAGGKNICNSEGTGFLVSDRILLTAYHVIDIDLGCDRVVVVRSRKHNFEAIATEVAHIGDMVAMKVEPIDPAAGLCSLALDTKNVVADRGVRFAIPGSLLDPVPFPASIGDIGEFNPNVAFYPAPVHPGDSGGPVVHLFRVVGMTKERLPKVDGYGLMIPVEQIRALLKNIDVQSSGFLCNPLMYAASNAGVTIELAKKNLSGFENSQIIGSVSKSIGGFPFKNIFASFHMGNAEIVAKQAIEAPLQTKTPSDKQIEIMNKPTEENHVNVKMNEVLSAEIQAKVEEDLWKQYMAEFEKNNPFPAPPQRK